VKAKKLMQPKKRLLKKKLDCFDPAFEKLLGNGARSGAVFFCQLAF
jgi:hypothetical protein